MLAVNYKHIYAEECRMKNITIRVFNQANNDPIIERLQAVPVDRQQVDFKGESAIGSEDDLRTASRIMVQLYYRPTRFTARLQRGHVVLPLRNAA